METKKQRKPPRIKIASAKAKARNLQKWIAQKIADATGIECGKDCLIESREMGQSGVDVKLIGEALDLYPFSIEAKNQETWNIPDYIRQAIANQQKGTSWQLFVKRNHFPRIVIMDAEVWFDIWLQLLNKYDDGCTKFKIQTDFNSASLSRKPRQCRSRRDKK